MKYESPSSTLSVDSIIILFFVNYDVSQKKSIKITYCKTVVYFHMSDVYVCYESYSKGSHMVYLRKFRLLCNRLFRLSVSMHLILNFGRPNDR